MYGREIVIRVNRKEVNYRYKLLLSNSCDRGNGTLRVAGTELEEPISVTRLALTEDNRELIPVAGAQYLVTFQGQTYETTYEGESSEGIPIDVYFYKIRTLDGAAVTVNGQQLWGRFVRNPAVAYSDQSNVVWWHATWVQRGGQWARADSKGVKVVVLKRIR